MTVGRAGEAFAAACLAKEGYTILARNYRCRYGEMDLVAAREGILAFVEVKTRRQGALVAAEEAVTPQKRRRLARTAACYLQQTQDTRQPRFDLFIVYTAGGARFLATRYEHLEGVFETDETDWHD